MKNKASQAQFILANPNAFRDPSKMVDARAKAIETMEQALQQLKEPTCDVEFVVSKAHGVLGLVKKQLETQGA